MLPIGHTAYRDMPKYRSFSAMAFFKTSYPYLPIFYVFLRIWYRTFSGSQTFEGTCIVIGQNVMSTFLVPAAII